MRRTLEDIEFLMLLRMLSDTHRNTLNCLMASYHQKTYTGYASYLIDGHLSLSDVVSIGKTLTVPERIGIINALWKTLTIRGWPSFG